MLIKLRKELGQDDAGVGEWYRDWIIRGFTALEEMAEPHKANAFLFSDQPTLADICLVPQMANARRYDTDLSQFPRLVEVDAACQEVEAFAKAAPEMVKPD